MEKTAANSFNQDTFVGIGDNSIRVDAEFGFSFRFQAHGLYVERHVAAADD